MGNDFTSFAEGGKTVGLHYTAFWKQNRLIPQETRGFVVRKF
jgi:hypothetical protein